MCCLFILLGVIYLIQLIVVLWNFFDDWSDMFYTKKEFLLHLIPFYFIVTCTIWLAKKAKEQWEELD